MPATLEDAHCSLSRLLGPAAEPIEVLQTAEEHRNFWRPENVRVVLLAESHVYTTPLELQRTMRPLAELPANLPRRFVRLVYCLGYGEDGLLDRPIVSPRNSGTPQFWKIFQSCITPVGATPDCAPIQVSRTPDARSRLRAKLRLLAVLRDRGVWLVDASIAALYLPGQPKPVPETRDTVLQTSWDRYTGAIVASAAPEAIICIGLGVARSLRTRLGRLGIPWRAVHQPQARLSREQHSAINRVYSTVCSDPSAIRSVPSII